MTSILDRSANMVPADGLRYRYLSWGAIVAGALLNVAISSIMVSFGSAIGLTLVSPYPGRTASVAFIAVAAALWALWVAISSFAAGGYLAGRMAGPGAAIRSHESDIRDGAHGLTVWAVGAMALMALSMATVGGATKAAFHGAAATMAGGAVALGQPVDPVALAVDKLSRSPDASETLVPGAREEFARIFVQALQSGSLNDGDRAYVAAKISAVAGIPQAEANQRIDDTLTQLKQAEADAKKLAEEARKIAVVMAFLTAAVSLIGGAAAWQAAIVGGRHRDEGHDLSRYIRRR